MQTRAAALLFLLATALPAQDRVEPAPPAPSVSTYAIDFPGGTLSTFAEMLRKGASPGHPANIVVSSNASEVDVPRVQLVDVTAEDALRAVASVVATRWRLDVRSWHDGHNGKPAISVTAYSMGTDTPPPQPRVLRVLSLAILTHTTAPDKPRMEAATVLTAVETALQLIGGAAPDVKYHEDSALLFVRGTPEQADAAMQVVGQLENDLQQRRNREAAARAQRPSPAQPPVGERGVDILKR